MLLGLGMLELGQDAQTDVPRKDDITLRSTITHLSCSLISLCPEDPASELLPEGELMEAHTTYQ